nr:unnamed protein product [Callosobruchus chinensis]
MSSVLLHVRAYGKESNCGILLHSNISRQLENGALNANQGKILPGADIASPHFLDGNEACPIGPYIEQINPQRNLTQRTYLTNP